MVRKASKMDAHKEFSLIVREQTNTTHPEHYLQRLIDRGIIKHVTKGEYRLA